MSKSTAILIGEQYYSTCKRCGRSLQSGTTAETGLCPYCLKVLHEAYEEDAMRDMNGALGRHNDDLTLIERDVYGNEVPEGPRFDAEAWLKGKK